jgi:hypothetical protein
LSGNGSSRSWVGAAAQRRSREGGRSTQRLIDHSVSHEVGRGAAGQQAEHGVPGTVAQPGRERSQAARRFGCDRDPQHHDDEDGRGQQPRRTSCRGVLDQPPDGQRRRHARKREEHRGRQHDQTVLPALGRGDHDPGSGEEGGQPGRADQGADHPGEELLGVLRRVAQQTARVEPRTRERRRGEGQQRPEQEHEVQHARHRHRAAGGPQPVRGGDQRRTGQAEPDGGEPAQQEQGPLGGAGEADGAPAQG